VLLGRKTIYMTVCVYNQLEVALDTPDLDSDCVRCEMFTPTET